MGRPALKQTLSIWANGQRVGAWTLDARREHWLQYDPQWVASPGGRPLSLSMPFLPENQPHRGAVVLNYFDNLLPDSDDIRKRLAAKFKVADAAAFNLLKAIGRDCVGAVQLLGEHEEPDSPLDIHGEVLQEADVERLILGTLTAPGLGMAIDEEQELRISLAGAQEKTALLRWEGRWMRPSGATPTTHIIKLPLGFVGAAQVDFSDSVDNEWVCLKLLAEFGLPVAQASIETFGAQRVLVVQRFDRRMSRDGAHLLRLPQEDFCQALGVPYLRKYEADGGPGLLDIVRVLHGANNPQRDLRTLLKAQLLFWLLRAPDQHAKNFSIALQAGGRYELTPLYDVLSAWPVLGDGPNQWSPHRVKLSMAVHGKSKHYDMAHVMRRHFNHTAYLTGYGRNMEDVIQEVLADVPNALDRTRAAFPDHLSHKVGSAILDGVKVAAESLSRMPA